MTLTVAQVAERFAVSEGTVLHWLHSGQLAGLYVGRDPGKRKARWRIGEAALQAFELTRTATPPLLRTRHRK